MANLFKKISLFLKREPNWYGFATLIKKYASFPQWIPLPAHYEHGWIENPNPAKVDLGTSKKLMLVFSKRREKTWKMHSNIPVAIMGAPFAHYRRMNNIIKDIDAKGSIVFPTHSTPFINVDNNINDFCRRLNELNPHYHPVTICLHGEDIKRGVDKEYLKRGFKVVSSGTEITTDFYINFYNILRKFNYSISNSIGSHTFYSIEMDIPFLYLDIERQYEYYGDPSFIDPDSETEEYRKYSEMMKQLLSSKNGFITDEQRAIVIDELGINDCLSGRKLRLLLWKTFLFNDLFLYVKRTGRYIKRNLKF